jgi:2-polyprenyl-3-methyl-5-hydroxy-6-metoxy-1,4-benzoquinol methylase
MPHRLSDAPDFTERCDESYVSTHAGHAGEAAVAHVYRRYVRPHLPAPAPDCRILAIGCGRGSLVRLMHRDGYDAHGIDTCEEQVACANTAGVDRARLADFHSELTRTREAWNAIVATDVLEHLNKEETIRTFDEIRNALRPNGVFVARVPNAVSPTGSHVIYGDLTHTTWFTRRSAAQPAALAGFARLAAFPCPPITHGVVSAARVIVWKAISLPHKVSLAAETGQLRGHIVTQNIAFVAHRDCGITDRTMR